MKNGSMMYACLLFFMISYHFMCFFPKVCRRMPYREKKMLEISLHKLKCVFPSPFLFPQPIPPQILGPKTVRRAWFSSSLAFLFLFPFLVIRFREDVTERQVSLRCRELEELFQEGNAIFRCSLVILWIKVWIPVEYDENILGDWSLVAIS